MNLKVRFGIVEQQSIYNLDLSTNQKEDGYIPSSSLDSPNLASSKTSFPKKLRIGGRFGCWKILKPIYKEGSTFREQETLSPQYYLCLCLGCKKTERKIRKWNLLKNQTESCGCQRVKKMRKTNEEKYGVEFPQQDPEIKEKSKQTLIERYGEDNYAKTEEFKEKVKETSLENWGEEHYRKSAKWKEKRKPKLGAMVFGQTKF